MKNFCPLVSCIVPVYNAEKYLDQAIQSLVKQTYKNLEIILVDDKSTDKSWSMCKNFSIKFPNIVCFKNDKNSGGPLRGRERGISESKGDWITFMDCDDYVGPNYIQNLINATENGKYDIAVTGHSRLYSNNKVVDFVWGDYSQTSEERLKTFYEHFLTHNFWTDPMDTVGQNLIRESICKSTDLSKYSDTVYAEDTLMALAFLANSKNGINFVDKHDFFWRQLEGSGSHGGFSDVANKDEFFYACLDIFHKENIYNKISQDCDLISVIIPVFNVEEHLEECLKSIVNQTYQNIEIIIVNDGSQDKSQAIVDDYKIKDARIVDIKQPNLGLNMARASGVKIAQGKYISFVDSDDIIHKNYISILYENLRLNNVDMSICGFKEFEKLSDIVSSDKIKSPYSVHILKSRTDVINYFLSHSASIPNVYQMTAWGKLYKSTIIKSTNWEMSNYKRHEDNLETLQWYDKSKKGLVVGSSQLYYYRKNLNSITRTPKTNISPKGRELNYFEFLQELFVKTKKYLREDVFTISILNQFDENNRVQLQNYFIKGWLNEKDIQYVCDNILEINKQFNKQIQTRDAIIQKQEEVLKNVYNSNSWRLTQPARSFKSRYNRLIRRQRK